MGAPWIETRHLLLVSTIVDAGTVTRAAARLGVTQSAVSHQLADLEERLGAPLFVRGRRLALTPAGERFLVGARRVLGELASLDEAVRAQSRLRLRVSTECYTCYDWLPRVLAGFRERHPSAEVRIVLEATRRPVEALLRDELDLAIVTRPVRDRSLVAQPLVRDELVVLVPAAHPLAARRHVRGEDFHGQSLLVYDLPREDLEAQRRALLPPGVALGAVHRVPLTEVIVELVKAGQGLAVLARWAIAAHASDPRLAIRPFAPSGLWRTWSGVRLRSAPAGPVLDALAGAIAADARARLGRPPASPRGAFVASAAAGPRRVRGSAAV